MLTERQRSILRLLVGDHLDYGRPVGSKRIAERADVEWGPSTVRADLAALEEEGYLTHPHTSAGRVPTEAGYRLYVDGLLDSAEKLPAPRAPLDLSQARREIDGAMRDTSAELARITELLALVTAPPPESATIHRVEALLLQPHVVMVVVITSSGGVRKRVYSFQRPLDTGLVEWASSYLNETLAGLSVGSGLIASRLEAAELGDAELRFLAEVSGAFKNLAGDAGEALYVDGAAHLLAGERQKELPQVDSLMRALERRANLLSMMRSMLDQPSVYLWIGEENPQPELRSASFVGANYGLGWRNLGSVGVIGPLRMDYATAIASVREAAEALSRFFESVYDE